MAVRIAGRRSLAGELNLNEAATEVGDRGNAAVEDGDADPRSREAAVPRGRGADYLRVEGRERREGGLREESRRDYRQIWSDVGDVVLRRELVEILRLDLDALSPDQLELAPRLTARALCRLRQIASEDDDLELRVLALLDAFSVSVATRLSTFDP